MSDRLQPRTVLGVAAHPDDLDFGAAGTLAKWAATGAAVHYLILTDGGKGTADEHQDPAALVAARQAEQRAAATAIGAKSVTFAGFEDGRLNNSIEVKRDVIRAIRRLRPDTVITWDPASLYSPEQGIINHPDHRAAGQATLDAVYPLARDHLSYPELMAEGLKPHKVKHVLLMTYGQPNYFEDIEQYIDAKLAAVGRHMSQFGEPEQVMVKHLAREAGHHIGVAAAESFLRITLAS